MAIIKKKRKPAIHLIIKLIIFVGIIVFVSNLVPKVTKNEVYPKTYEEYVLEYSKEYNIDENFVFAVIKTESNFNKKATSDVGARGLMQIMEEAFEWVKSKLKDDDSVTYDSMYEPQCNIRYGCFMLGYYYEKYGSYELAAMAYHSGMTTVDNWLSQGIISYENLDIDSIPTSKTQHYVKKVIHNYEAYNNLYEK